MNTITKIYETCRASRDEDGVSTISAKDVAVIIRLKLKVAFPAVKFSVRSDHNSVNIHWTDGPLDRDVEAITSAYKFGGFDGMIDLAYYSKNWLLPDGSMILASCEGTEGSRGSVPSDATDCPMPGAIIVKYGPRYVFANRSVSDQRMLDLCYKAALHYGFHFRPELPLHSQHVPQLGEYLTTVAHRFEMEHATA